MFMSRLALCETDHASVTGDIRGFVLRASDDTEILRERVMMAASVVVTSFSMRLRNFGRAENKGRSENPFRAMHTKE
jgi:hypothetical protein